MHSADTENVIARELHVEVTLIPPAQTRKLWYNKFVYHRLCCEVLFNQKLTDSLEKNASWKECRSAGTAKLRLNNFSQSATFIALSPISLLTIPPPRVQLSLIKPHIIVKALGHSGIPAGIVRRRQPETSRIKRTTLSRRPRKVPRPNSFTGQYRKAMSFLSIIKFLIKQQVDRELREMTIFSEEVTFLNHLLSFA